MSRVQKVRQTGSSQCFEQEWPEIEPSLWIPEVFGILEVFVDSKG